MQIIHILIITFCVSVFVWAYASQNQVTLSSLPLVLFFAYLPLRIFNKLNLSLEASLVFVMLLSILFLVCGFWWIPRLFNTYFCQRFFYTLLTYEEMIRMSFPYSFVFLFVMGFSLGGYWVFLDYSPLYYFFFYFLFGLYFYTKTQFFQFDLVIATENERKEYLTDFTWGKLIFLMGKVSFQLFGRKIENKLPHVENLLLPEIGRRYLVTHKTTFLKISFGEALGGLITSVGAFFGVVYLERNNERRHSELLGQKDRELFQKDREFITSLEKRYADLSQEIATHSIYSQSGKLSSLEKDVLLEKIRLLENEKASVLIRKELMESLHAKKEAGELVEFSAEVLDRKLEKVKLKKRLIQEMKEQPLKDDIDSPIFKSIIQEEISRSLQSPAIKAPSVIFSSFFEFF